MVRDGGDDQNDDQQHDPSPNTGSFAGLGIHRRDGTVAVVVQIVLVQGGKQGQHTLAVFAGRHIVVEVLAEIDPHLAVRQGVVHTHGKIGVAALGVDGQITVIGTQLKFLSPVVGVLLQAGIGSVGQGLYHDDAAVPFVPVGIVEADLLLLVLGEYAGKVPDPPFIGSGRQGIIQPRGGGSGAAAPFAQANAHSSHDHGGGNDPRHPGFLENFHNIPRSSAVRYIPLQAPLLGDSALLVSPAAPTASASTRPRSFPARLPLPSASGRPQSGSS